MSAPKTVKEILGMTDCECTHPESLHKIPVDAQTIAKAIPDGHCRVSGCDCEMFVEKKPEPEVLLCRICRKFNQLKEELCVPCLDRNVHQRMMILVERIEEMETDIHLLNGMVNP